MRLALISSVLTALVLAAVAIAADPEDAKTRIDRVDQARAEALREVLFNAESQRAMREHAMREAIGGGRSHEAEESPEQP